MTALESPAREGYEVLLREFDWANAPADSDPHYWVVTDIRLNSRSLFDDFRSLSPYPPGFSWETWGGFLQWSRTRDQALQVAEAMIEDHRSHFVEAA